MAKILNEDGVPTEIPSVARRRTTRPSRAPTEGLGEKSRLADKPAAGRRSLFPDEPPTRPATRPGRSQGGASGAYSPSVDEPRTVIAGGWRSRPPGLSDDLSSGANVAVHGTRPDPMVDPVVGWLVIVDGPGKGSAVRLGNGQNGVGRGRSARARVDFGDRQISRETHAVVTYDPKNNRFWVSQGSGTNLTYLGDSPVLAPTPLEPGARIVMGETTLRFVAFCDKDFTWAESESAGAHK